MASFFCFLRSRSNGRKNNMQEPEGILLIRKIREELLREKESMSPDEWNQLAHERVQIMEKRIADQRAINAQEEANQQPIESGH